MPKRIISMITLTFYVLFLYGCYTIDSLEMSDANLENFDGDRIISIITNDSIIYEFENNEFKPKPYIADSTLIGWIKTESMGDPLDVEEVQIPISEIKTLNFENNKTTYVISLLGGIIGVAVIISWIASELESIKLPGPRLKLN